MYVNDKETEIIIIGLIMSRDVGNEATTKNSKKFLLAYGGKFQFSVDPAQRIPGSFFGLCVLCK